MGCPKTLDLKKCDMSDTKEGKLTRDMNQIPDSIINRQKHTKTKKYIYEVKWMNKSLDSNTWVEREILMAMGYSKIVMKKDESEAASHAPIHSLSHGQKVKVVICASCWQILTL